MYFETGVCQTLEHCFSFEIRMDRRSVSHFAMIFIFRDWDTKGEMREETVKRKGYLEEGDSHRDNDTGQVNKSAPKAAQNGAIKGGLKGR